jgi:hypothetical protein
MKHILPSSALYALAVASALFTGTAHASLLGDSVDCDVQPIANGTFWSCSLASATVVDPGVEFQLNLAGNPFFDVDLDSNSITLINLSALGTGAGEFLTLSSLDWLDFPAGEIEDFSLVTLGVAGLNASDITLTAHSVGIDFNGTQWRPGDFAEITLQVNHAVPEPTTLLLLGLGLAGLGFAKRRLH